MIFYPATFHPILLFSSAFPFHSTFIPHLTILPSFPSPCPPYPPPGSLVVMAVTQETTYQRRVCVRTVILCVNSVWDPGPATVPPAKTQGDVLWTFYVINKNYIIFFNDSTQHSSYIHDTHREHGACLGLQCCRITSRSLKQIPLSTSYISCCLHVYCL